MVLIIKKGGLAGWIRAYTFRGCATRRLIPEGVLSSADQRVGHVPARVSLLQFQEVLEADEALGEKW